MAKVIGIKPTSYDFTGRDGQRVQSEGYTFYTSFEMKDCEGVACEKVYLSFGKLGDGAIPHVGDEVEVMYNRFGKPSGLRIVG